MEGKSVLFRKFAGIDCFDIELESAIPTSWSTSSPPSADFRRHHLEDIKAPSVHHRAQAAQAHEDPGVPTDQHAPAITVAAAIFNAEGGRKRIEEVKLVTPARRGGARLPRAAGEDGPAARGITVTDIKGGCTRPARGDGPG